MVRDAQEIITDSSSGLDYGFHCVFVNLQIHCEAERESVNYTTSINNLQQESWVLIFKLFKDGQLSWPADDSNCL